MPKLSKFYDKKKAEELIKARYRKSIPSIRKTLKRIVPTERFQQLKDDLRNQGWKDWHILLAFFNLVMNYRMEKLGISGNIFAMEKFYQEYPYEEEKEDAISVPIEEITEEDMKRNLQVSMMATLNGFGFSIQGKLVKPEEISKFLAEKFNYWEDDVDHDPIFDID
ncbi:MAG: hypothetical protein ACFFDF_10195 [Candidatus Odinarchaeota archaeon]